MYIVLYTPSELRILHEARAHGHCHLMQCCIVRILCQYCITVVDNVVFVCYVGRGLTSSCRVYTELPTFHYILVYITM